MNIYQQIINQKLKTITPEELLTYANQYNIQVTKEQARKVIILMKNQKSINIFSQEERKQLLREIARVTSPDVARQLNSLFIKFTK
ncbi:DUF2624 domain-containing protein [Fredinandcohnia quinoae]|uniref:DUF2624 domain-containing protein n=1 Tax=Fredinandcohnia quinoae TaxID=2918902 RepID=A0AAW5E846_9BACI|nr:DUF2624 domain-containing protein [Fredinandcohnia sp. SECRCQ15]MCH1624954.1 DUF2624 domain-containing protein [Fredinandcohnia sp. SECRCQ15]